VPQAPLQSSNVDPELVQVAQITWSRQRRVIEAEGACEQVLGSPPEVLLGQSLHRVLGVSEAKGKELDEKALAAKPVETEFVVIPGSEEVFRLALGRRNHNASAGITSLRLLLAGAPPVQIWALASSLGHEIANPLSSVKMAVQTLARNTSLSERDQRRLAIANREIRTIERTLWLLSEYGRSAAPAAESIALRALVHETTALIQSELTERRTEIQIEDQVPMALVRVDAGRVQRVISQLLLQVAIGMPEGSALLVTLRRGRHEGFEMTVADPTPGTGSTEGGIELVSPPLGRGGNLWMAALQRVMEAHGGKVELTHWSGGTGRLYTLSFPG
jgi:two-component system, NtrC family, sensor histidine kinase HydH